MDKVREEFEKWFEKEKSRGDRHHGLQRLVKETMFEGWVGRKETAIVKIPVTGEQSSFGDYIVFDYDCVVKMLEEAGVRYEQL